MRSIDLRHALAPHLRAAIFGLLGVGLMLVWAVHDGGYDAETWYWGALASLGLLAAALFGAGAVTIPRTRAARVAIAGFALYVAWSYLSMTWAQSPGIALEGSNRALLYLIVFTLFLGLPWTAQGAITALLVFAIGVGTIAVVYLFRFAASAHVPALFEDDRLAAPTGYLNASAALFTMGALLSIALSARRELPGVLRGLLQTLACADFQLALVGQSRGWLFTLPIVALFSIVLVADRLRVVLFAALPIAGVAIPLRRLLHVYDATSDPALTHAAARAGQAGLVACVVVLVLGILLAWGDRLRRGRGLATATRRVLGAGITLIVMLGIVAALTGATHGHPVHFVTRQWQGFSHTQSASDQSHFADVGSGRFDFWRVALDATLAHPIGGLGQDNFADYYVLHRRTGEEPSWTHSLELRLLAHTGIVGFALFGLVIVGATAAALRARRRGNALTRGVAGAALIPFTVWLVHGSVDWFWEIPALSGPALGFLGMAGALGRPPLAADRPPQTGTAHAGSGPPRFALGRRSVPPVATRLLAVVALVVGTIVLALPYLSVREVSLATDLDRQNPSASLADLRTAHRLNPLDPDPGRLAGTIALDRGEWATAQHRFRQAIHAEPGGWFSWLGAGLAASGLGQRATARAAFAAAHRINPKQPATGAALRRVDTAHPLTPTQAFKLLVIAQ